MKRRSKLNRRAACLSVLALKFFPVMVAAMLTTHLVLSSIGIEVDWLHQLAGVRVIPALVLVIISVAFNFCKLHICFTIFDTVTTYICHDEEYALFENMWLRLLFIAIGLMLFVNLYIHWKCYNNGSRIEETVNCDN